MIPDIQFLGKTLTPYTLMVLAGALVVFWYLYRQPEKLNLDPIHATRMGLFSAIGVFFGGSLLFGLTNIDKFLNLLGNLDKAESPIQVLQALGVIFGGSVYYGGLLGCLLVSYIYLRKNKLPVGAYSDLGAPGIALFHTFGRVGCFFSGCCYGVPWPHGVVYHYSSAPDANGVARFPVQLVEASLNLVLFCLLFFLLRRGKMKGKLLGLYLLIYPVYRFGLEFFRGDEYRGFLLGLSTSQIISVLLFGAAVVFFFRGRKNIAQETRYGGPQ